MALKTSILFAQGFTASTASLATVRAAPHLGRAALSSLVPFPCQGICFVHRDEAAMRRCATHTRTHQTHSLAQVLALNEVH
ncbi:hypothetical protein BDZ90DRAFT_232511 [Jaminaea rosea]|uniref:Uncharacterized protein n=1 Tax=Jaminaea rosea TaxID=1569628 RepID=A0A316UQH0_9BASI|nr:hypothetical protein BDZ90DRAFT_232511 [Jaminaea rosea]PWN27536.1 hypothetical protein BDZ90DRAFT_232511 [Jaminaea rosea]